MQNIKETDWEKLQAQLEPVVRIQESVRQEHRRLILNFLHQHTQENHCFTETIVRKDGRLKMAYSLGKMSMYPTLHIGSSPLPIFVIKESNLIVCYGNNYKSAGPTLIHEPTLSLLDNLNLIGLLEKKVQEENTDPEIFIPEGFMAFRFQAIWGAGGYDDDHSTVYAVPLKMSSLDDGFDELKKILFHWNRENSFGDFWIAMSGADKWQKIIVEPAYANFTPSVSRLSLGELKLVKDKL